MSNARSPVADPTASTEIKILNGTSLAVTRMPKRNADGISVNIQDANSPKASQGKTIIRDTCDSMIRLSNNPKENFRRGNNFRTSSTVLIFMTPLSNNPQLNLRWEPVIWSPLTFVQPAKTTKIQKELSLSKRKIRGMNWADRCSLKWRLYYSEHPHGGCRFSEPSMLLSITGVQPRKLRVKDWQNAHGKVGIRAVSSSV